MPPGNFEPPERVVLCCAGRHIQVGRKLDPPYGTHYDPGSGPIWLSSWAAAVLTWDEDWSAPDTSIDTAPLKVPTSGPGLRACMGLHRYRRIQACDHGQAAARLQQWT